MSKSEDDASILRFEPVRLDLKDIDVKDIDVFALIKDLIVNSGIAKERKE